MEALSFIGQLLTGFLLGYVVSTCLESYLHKHIHHARKPARALWNRIYLLGRVLQDAYFQHSAVHHGLTFRKSFVNQFDSAGHKAEVDAYLEKKSQRHTAQERYGLTLYGWGFLKFNLPILPVGTLIYILFGPVIFIGSIPTLFAFSFMSTFIHPYIHMPYVQAIQSAPYIIRVLLRSNYIKFAYVNHFMHHKYLNCNFNLLLGGDFILGYYRAPDLTDIIEMQAAGLPVDCLAKLHLT